MQITSEPLEPRQVRLTIVVPPSILDAAMREVAQHYARHERISGYRPGKVPVARIAKLVGEDNLRSAAIEQLTEDVVRQAIESEDLRPSAPASVKIAEEEPLTFEVVVPLQPHVDLGDYTALRVERAEPEPVTDAEIEATIQRWRDDLSTLETVERPAEADDVVALALVGRDGDETLYEEEALTLALDDSGASAANLPPEVIDEIIGLSAGDAQTFGVTYPDAWPQEELRGREVDFTASVVSVSGRNAPDLDDAFAREVSGLDSIDDLRSRLRDQLESRAAMDARDEHLSTVVDALVESADVQYPPTLLDTEVAGMIADLRQRVERQGFTWSRWLELQQKDEDALWSELEGEADARLRRRLVMIKFVDEEDIDVGRDEVDAEVQRLTRSLPRSARRTLPDDDDLRQDAGSRILTGRALDRLIAITSGEPAGPSAAAPASEDVAPASENAAPASDDVAPASEDAAPASEDAEPASEEVESPTNDD